MKSTTNNKITFAGLLMCTLLIKFDEERLFKITTPQYYTLTNSSAPTIG